MSESLMLLTGMKDWRQQHPKATLREIEQAMDERLAKLRAGLLEDLVKMSPQADWSQAAPERRPTCERCGAVLLSRGKRSRWLQTSGGQQVQLERSYGTCPHCGQGLFPLDEELDLDSSDLTPQAQEGLVRLATWVPYARAAQLLEGLLGIQVSKASARRFTLRAGEAGLQEWEEQTAVLQQTLPQAPAEASKQVMSADGAMVPLVGGVWAEVKTLVIGEVEGSTQGPEHVQHLSYCLRLSDVPGFERATLREVHRRGLEQAPAVAAVTAGAEWLTGFIDYHRADAVRILDFAHAAKHVSAIGDAVRAAGHWLPKKWLEGVLHRLKHEGPERMLAHLSRLGLRCCDPEVSKHLPYLSARRSQMQYPLYQAAGWPIGSGIVESANKLVVEARLKGAGMHWKREHVNPMLLLGHAVCNDRWQESWQGRMKQGQQTRRPKRELQAQARLQQALTRLLRLWLPISLSRPRPQEPTLPSAPAQPMGVPKGRTEAQKRWGRQPISPRGVRLWAEFAKK